MDSIKIPETERTPLIEGSTSTGNLKISGRSYPDNAIEFFQPFREWLEHFYKDGSGDILLEINLDYINTATTVLLYDVVKNLSNLSNARNVKVIWEYDVDDYDMIDKGTDFKELLGEHITLKERGQNATAI